MANENLYNTARLVTGSSATDRDISIQYLGIKSHSKFLLVKAIDMTLKRYSLPLDTGWNILNEDFNNIALQYLIDPATAYCLFVDWKSKENVMKY